MTLCCLCSPCSTSLIMSVDDSGRAYGKSLTHTRLSRPKSYQLMTLIYKLPNSCQSFINTSLKVLLAHQSRQEAVVYLSPPVSAFSASFAGGYTLFHPTLHPGGLANSTAWPRGRSHHDGVNTAQPDRAACSGTSILSRQPIIR